MVRICFLTVLMIAIRVGAADGKVSMDVRNEELTKIIEIYSKASGQKFVVDPGVRGKISIYLPEPVSTAEAFNQLSSALAVNGYAISKQDDTMVVQSARNTQRNLIEVTHELPGLKPERMVTWVINLKHTPATKVNRDLRILTSKDGEMSVVESTNQLYITDWSSNLNRIALILKELDVPADPAVAKLVSAETAAPRAGAKKDAKKPQAPAEKNE